MCRRLVRVAPPTACKRISLIVEPDDMPLGNNVDIIAVECHRRWLAAYLRVERCSTLHWSAFVEDYFLSRFSLDGKLLADFDNADRFTLDFVAVRTKPLLSVC